MPPAGRDPWSHEHVYLGDAHDANERRTWAVVALTAAMMVGEIVAGTLFNSMALLADGWHMATHAGALGIAALAYRYARSHARDPRFTFGTGKVGDLAGYTSAVVLGVVALLIAAEAVERLGTPLPIAFDEAIAVAALGLVVNLVSAGILARGHGHDHGHGPAHGHGLDRDHDSDRDHARDRALALDLDHDHHRDRDHDHARDPHHDHDHDRDRDRDLDRDRDQAHDHDHDHDRNPHHDHARDHDHDHDHDHDRDPHHDHAHVHDRDRDPHHDHDHARDLDSARARDPHRDHAHDHDHDPHHDRDRERALDLDHDREHHREPDRDHPPALAPHARHGHAHADHNLRAAYLHVLADALTSVLALVALVLGRAVGARWLDPLMGIVGAVVIARWSLRLLRDTGRVLLDAAPEGAVAAAIRRAVEARAGRRVSDLHLWRVGPGHVAAIVSVVSDGRAATDAEEVRAAIAAVPGVAHLTVEVRQAGS